MNISRSVLVVLLALCLALGTGGAASAQQGADGQYFAQTGHWVSGPFWAYYQGLAEAQLTLGYPITEAFQDVRTGALVQYFQRARLEYHPEFDGAPILPTQLGRMLYKPGAPTLNLVDLFACRAYSETGFSVCYAFLEFFDKHGGVATFGFPISGFETYNGRIVQYFERARFEWYPDRPEGQKVVLGDLGRIYFDSVPENAQLLAPAATRDALISDVLQLQTHVFVWKAVALPSDRQLIFVVVQDQTLRPVAGASGLMTVSTPLATLAPVSFTTNNAGVAILELPLQNQPVGALISVSVTSSYLDLTGAAQSSFRIWQ